MVSYDQSSNSKTLSAAESKRTKLNMKEPNMVPFNEGENDSENLSISLSASSNSYRLQLQNYDRVSEFASSHGGSFAIQRVLIANNGIAAVKEMRSVRKWAYQTFNDDRVVEFIAMATPDDFKANAEYIKMADRVVEVPGGTNNNNYANVDLIVKLAQEQQVQAVWAGWGHASENPKLPEGLSRCDPPIEFIGPKAASMRALGDKISSTIVAQSLDIPVVPWSGSGIIMDPADCFDSAKCEPIFESAGIKSIQEAQERSHKIGFPLMIKASEGGGGKGIRKAMKAADLKFAFEQVQKEVPGSPIFLMKLSEHNRHLEIQVVADQHGQVLTLFGRDCSVQRRHQKIIEEAPISVVPEEVAWQMETDAIKLAHSVHYESVGTVEYLYDLNLGKYYFLELNPRLQVEHPTTEMVSGVNIPACQLQIAMGIPLHRIEAIRSLWGRDPSGFECFEFSNETRKRPMGHVIASRITAENPDAGFKPNSGKLLELNFKGFPETWGYFSVAPFGGLHEYADSQFGHIFAHGPDRSSAIKNMVMALKELCIRGDFRTTVEYLIELLEKKDFHSNDYDTAWLDELIAAQKGPIQRLSQEIAVIGGGAALAIKKFSANETDVLKAISGRGIPNPTLLASELNIQFILANVSYSCTAIKSAPNQIILNFTPQNEIVTIGIKQHPDGGYLMNIDGKTHTAYVKEEGDNYRVTIDGKTCILESEQDPSTIVSPSPGKLVRYLVDNGSHVISGTPVAEIEVMKMFIPLQCNESGRIALVKPAGSSIETGDLIASLELDNPSQVAASKNITSYNGGAFIGLKNYLERVSFIELDENIQNILQGYVVPDYKGVVNEFYDRFNESKEVIEYFWAQVTSLSGRIDADLDDNLREILGNNLKSKISNDVAFENLINLIASRQHLSSIDHLKAAVKTFFPSGRPESLIQFKRSLVSRIIEGYWKVERAFHGDVTAESLYANLSEFHSSEQALADCFRSHYNLQYKNQVLLFFLNRLLESPDWGHELLKASDLEASLRQLTIFSGPNYFSVVHVTRDLLLQSKNISPVFLYQEMEGRLLQALAQGQQSTLLEGMILGRYASMDVLPKFFHHSRPDVRNWAVEAYIRRTFQSYSIQSVSCINSPLPPGAISAFKWTFLANSADQNESNGENNRLGLIAVFDESFSDAKVLMDLIEACLHSEAEKSIRKVIYFILPESWARNIKEEEEFSAMLVKNIASLKEYLNSVSVRRVTFALNRSHLLSMNYFTLRASLDFCEDRNIRHVEPALAYLLELKRITDNHDITLKYADPEGQVHIYLASEKDCKKAESLVQKMFVRLLVRPNQMMREHRTMLHFFPAARAILEQMFETQESIMAKETWIPRVKDKFICSNHLFINIIAVFFHSAEEVAQVLEHLMVYYDERFNRLGIRSAEVVMNLVECRNEGNPVDLRKSRELISDCQRVRFFFENPLGLVNATEMHAYRENYHEDGKLRLECFYGKPKKNGDQAFASYNTLSDLELRRNRVLKLGSTYIYDFPQLFEHILAEIWNDYQKTATSSEEACLRIEFQQILLNSDQKGVHLNNTSCALSAENKNRIGMVAWLVRYAAPEYSNGREFVLIGNDLDHEIGTFGVAEDNLFFHASEYARMHGIPRIYIASNSGAKFGLAGGLMERVQVAWVDAGDHSKGFEFLYLEELIEGDEISLATELIRLPPSDKPVYKIIAIIGSPKEGLGVENLQGSGLIAGATARAYDEIFTLTYVTGRAVGIGAYLVRLGHRTIQKQDSPIILTGAQALNSILGRDVYLSNIQIGGPHIMAANGISHRTVSNDFDGVREIFHWLSFVTVNRSSCPLDLITPELTDSVDRSVKVPSQDIANDPRAFLKGSSGVPGLLDVNSWTEYLEGWAKSVIIGRGRLGGIPVGVICTETRAIEWQEPCDPGRTDRNNQVVKQAGQVWYPDSAWKTAQALRDFRTEGLPILILANWRGFSGGPGDLFDGILQFGSMIVEELAKATTPVMVYLPAGAELRGGSWVVLDSTINPDGRIEMYADPTARAGVMEPEGIVSVKFRKREISKLMLRLESHMDAKIEEDLDCVYHQIAVKYADLHDSALRMLAKGVIKGIIPQQDSRAFLYNRLKRRLLEGRLEKIVDKQYALDVLNEFCGRVSSNFNGEKDFTKASDEAAVKFLEFNFSELQTILLAEYKKRKIDALENELKRLRV